MIVISENVIAKVCKIDDKKNDFRQISNGSLIFSVHCFSRLEAVAS